MQKTSLQPKRKAAARSTLAGGSDSSPTLEEIVRVTSALGIKFRIGLTPINAPTPREKQLEAAIRWALGETDFGPRPQGAGPYWWRTELRTRAGLGNPNDRDVPTSGTNGGE